MENKENGIVGKFLVGEDHNIPYEVRDGEDGLGGYVTLPDGSEELRTNWIFDKVLTPGKAMRVSDEEFEKAKADYID